MPKLMPGAVALCLVLVACSGDGAAPAAGNDSERRPATIVLPEQMLGLNVVREDVTANIEGVSGAYLDALGLYSFRQEDELLRATLQVGRFNEIAPQEKQRFRSAIIGQLGSTVPEERRLGDERVWLSTGNEQNIFSWFDDEGFFVLSIRSDYQFPRSLLRKLVTTDILR